MAVTPVGSVAPAAKASDGGITMVTRLPTGIPTSALSRPRSEIWLVPTGRVSGGAPVKSFWNAVALAQVRP